MSTSQALVYSIQSVLLLCHYVFQTLMYRQPWTNFWNDPEQDDHYRMTDINLDHPIKLTRIAMRQLVSEDRKGVVCTIASVGGLSGSYNCPLYIATKHGVVGFVKSMKLAEKYEGIKIVTICPGAVDTPLWDQDKREVRPSSSALAAWEYDEC